MMKRISEIAKTVDAHIASFPPHKTADARLLSMVLSRPFGIDTSGITDALRAANGEQLLTACEEVIDAGIRWRMMNAHMRDRGDTWHDMYLQMINAELGGENIQWQKLPWEADK